MPKKYIPTKSPRSKLCLDCKRTIKTKDDRCYICEADHQSLKKSIARLDEEYTAALRAHKLDDC